VGNDSIKVTNLSKDFRPLRRASSLKSKFSSLFSVGRSNNIDIPNRVLSSINITVGRGEFFGIVGKNGSGKSTLLKLLAGIYQPTSGAIDIRGRLVPFIELGVGFNPDLSGRDNVYLNGALLGFSKKQVDGMFESIVSFAELDGHMDEKLKNYSSGMQVRLAFSVAIRSEADILLVDEVLAVGDADFQNKCYEYFTSLKKSTTTVVFISHDMEAVRKYCDRVALIDNGKVISVDKPDRIAEKYADLFR
jgi:ABC-2 type transport system ATP-binding protein